jgi:hypothetical protein
MSERVTGRKVLTLRSSEHKFASTQYYVVFEAIEGSGTPYRFFFVQALVSINLFVFFAVFFGSFFLFLAGVIVVFKVGCIFF